MTDDLEWSAVDGPDGCCWRLCSRGLCVVAKTKGKALALLWGGLLWGLQSSNCQPKPPAPP